MNASLKAKIVLCCLVASLLPQARAGVCGNAMRRVLYWKSQWTRTPYMQDNQPIEAQVIAKVNKDDAALALAWVYRDFEARNGGRDLGGGIAGIVLNAQENRQSALFVVTIPDWKKLTNARLRALVDIRFLIRLSEPPSIFSVEDSDFVEHVREHIPEVQVEDIENWERAFPASPIPAELRAALVQVASTP